jgi:hypothetical protein
MKPISWLFRPHLNAPLELKACDPDALESVANDLQVISLIDDTKFDPNVSR